MSNLTPNPKKRSFLLPPGCKDLIDVLKRGAELQSAEQNEVVALHPISTEHVFVNGKIRAQEVRVCEENGLVLGVFSLADAIQLAARRGVDLVLVNAKVRPPLCVLIDYGKHCYQQAKKKKRKKSG